MSWKYDGLNPWALHLESQIQFGIRGKRKIESPSDFELIAPEKSINTWSPEKLDQLKADLWIEMKRVWEQGALRMRLSSHIRTKLSGDNYRAANVISGISGKTVSARSIQAWLIDPTKRSSRTCPEWAVEALETYSPPAGQVEREAGTPLSAWDVKTKYGVDFAEREIDANQKLRKKWIETSITAIPNELYELELKLSKHLSYVSDSLSHLKSALKTSKSFEEFQRLALEKLDDAADIRFFVAETKMAIEQGSDEFSNQEGLPAPRGVDK